MPMVLRTSTGLEEIGHGVLLQLSASVNRELVLQTSAWAPYDVAFSQEFGYEYFPTLLETIDPAHMYLGHVPTLIDAPPTDFPNLSVLASDSTLAPSMPDQTLEYLINFYVELMVKSAEPNLGSDIQQREVNKRIQRTTSAVHNVLMSDQTIGGLVYETSMRSLNITDVFIRREERARGAEFFWQGARIDYQVRVPADYRGM